MLNQNYASIEYSARTKLMDLAEEFAETRKRDRREKIIDQAATIRYYLKAVELKTTYLDDDTVNAIYQCLIDVAEINNYPTVPVLADVAVPDIGTTIIIEGTPGERGADGGGTDFEEVSVAIDTVVDSFTVADALGARWDYVVYDGTNQRAGSISTTWTSDGASVADPAHFSSADIGDTTGIELTVEFFSGDIRLVANVTSGTWTVVGSRYFIPNSGAFQGVSGGSSALTSGYIYVGNASNIATGVAVSGDITMSNAGVAAIASGVIVNADISGSAAIAVSKLAALTATKVVISDASGYLTTSSVTPTELGYLAGVTSAIQTQLDSKVSSSSGAISTVTSSDLTINRAVISNGSGKIAVSSVTTTELGYVSGVTSALQTQLNSRVNGVTETFYVKTINIGDWNMDSTLSVQIAHGIGDYTKIRGVDVVIRDNADAQYTSLSLVSGLLGGYYVVNPLGVNPTLIELTRVVSGWYDQITYNSTGFNRGWITITYIA